MSKSYIGLEDLLCDDAFLSWYFKRDHRSVMQWEQWLGQNPGSRERVAQAIAFLDSLRLEEEDVPAEQITYAESLLLEKIRQAEKKSRVYSLGGRYRWIAAASILFLFILSGGYWLLSRHTELRTAYGEVRESTLPDGTEVVVNADSKITCSPGWKDGKDREVWLRGEAFFHVAKTPLKSRFIVHTDHFDIIVTGTQFNVVNRPDKANIMLKEGSVILQTTEGRELKMAPGDFVEYQSATLEKRPVKSDSLIAWKEHRLAFDNTPARELVRIIREHYGVTVLLADETVGNMTVTGMLPNDNLDVLLQALDATGDFEVIREGSTITINRKHP